MCLMYQTLILSGLSGVLFFSFLFSSGLFPFGFPSLFLPFLSLPGFPPFPLFPPSSPLVPVLGPFPSSVLFFLFSSLSFPFPLSSLGCFFFPSFLLPFLFPPSFLSFPFFLPFSSPLFPCSPCPFSPFAFFFAFLSSLGGPPSFPPLGCFVGFLGLPLLSCL